MDGTLYAVPRLTLAIRKRKEDIIYRLQCAVLPGAPR